MKKATLILISILLALFAFTACNNSIDFIIDNPPEPSPEERPLTLEFTKDGEFWIDYSPTYETYFIGNVEYSKNGGEREVAADGVHIQVFTGDKICLYRDLGVRSSAPPMNINCSAESECYVYGNVMSLIDSESFAEVDAVPARSLDGLFQNNTHIINHESLDLLLPATTLAKGCYAYMFYGCTGLTRAPELPATTLAEACYYGMFYECTGLTVAPELPAETLANSCYMYMFSDCTSLETAPELPATTLTDWCYGSMFNGCTGLTTAPELPATTLADCCYYYMFYGCTGLTTAPEELPATTLADDCYESMFEGCTSLETAPVLPAESLVYCCYNCMFRGCSSLTSITCLATYISADSCTNEWVYGVSASGTFTRHDSGIIWPVNEGGIPSGWAIENYYN